MTTSRILTDGSFAGLIAVSASGGPMALKTAQIALGTALSAAVDCVDGRAIRVDMPAAWDAADLTFQVSLDGVTYSDLYDAYGSEYVVRASASRAILLNPVDFIGVRYLKVRSGTGAVPVNQTAARSITLTLLA